MMTLPKPDPAVYQSIPGGQELLNWFGHAPRFHDAEILEVTLRRMGPSTLTLHGFNMTNRVRGKRFVLEKHAVVTFVIEEIFELELDDFNHQNAIEGLYLSHVSPEASAKYAVDTTYMYEINVEPASGLGGMIRAQKVSVSYVPGKP